MDNYEKISALQWAKKRKGREKILIFSYLSKNMSYFSYIVQQNPFMLHLMMQEWSEPKQERLAVASRLLIILLTR